MGNLFTKVWGQLFANKEARILLLGLDNAGKTTILYKLARDEDVDTIPTLGFNVERIKYKRISMSAWDIGGQTRLRGLWGHYYNNTDAVIFVIDSNDFKRYQEARDTLKNVLSHDSLKNIKLLVYCNKQDLPKSVSANRLVDHLKLHDISKSVDWFVQPCSAKSGEGLYEGLDWLSSKL